MGRGYGAYWLARLAVGVPLIAFGVWRLISSARGLTPDEASQYWVRSATVGVCVALAIALAFALISWPYLRELRNSRGEGSFVFLARRTDELVRALSQTNPGRGNSWSYWIIVDISDRGVEFRARPAGKAASTVLIPPSEIERVDSAKARVAGLLAPVMTFSLADGRTIAVIPSRAPFAYPWGLDEIETTNRRVRAVLRIVEVA